MTSSTLLVAVAKEGGGLSPSPRFVTDLNAFLKPLLWLCMKTYPKPIHIIS